jgi:RNA polymerase sigma-70 factor, ECF subfamily
VSTVITLMTIDAIIEAHNAGDPAATSQLLERLYSDLRRIAAGRMALESPGHTLQTTALINEAYLRLCGHGSTPVNDRNHFLNLAARTMREILIDHARKKDAQKRGAGMVRVTLDDSWPPAPESTVDLAALGEALEELSKLSERQARVIDLRYFVGFSVEEAAGALGVSDKTVKNDTQFAKAWLRRRLSA